MGEVGGAVERIDIPAKLPLHAFASSLFAVDAVVGPCLADTRADEFLNGAVGHGDEVDIALVLRFHAGGQKFAQASTSLTRDLLGARNPDEIRGCGAAHSPPPEEVSTSRRLPDSVMVRIWCL